MARLLAALTVAATIAASAAVAQIPTPVQKTTGNDIVQKAATNDVVQKATVNDVKVSGVIATNANTGTATADLASATNLLDKFTDVQPAIPVLNPPARSPHSGMSKDCVGHNC
jgi:hypothetical protein